MDEVARTVLALVILIPRRRPGAAGGRRAPARAAWSATCCAVQLLTIGLLLGAVFRAPLAMLPVLAVLMAAATAAVTPRLSELSTRRRCWRPAAVAGPMATGAAVTASVIVGTGTLELEVRNLVAPGGITVGGAMTASTLAGRASWPSHAAAGPRSRASWPSGRRCTRPPPT